MNKKKNLLIFILMIGVFGIMNTEMGIIGILPLIAQKFNVNISTAGLLVSTFALVVALAGPIMPLLFSKVNRKTVMLLALSIFTLSNLISIFAQSFTILLIARVAPAAFHPIYVSMALSVAGTSVLPTESAKAVAKVFVGVSSGMVIGVPITNFIATEFSVAMAMFFFAIVNAAVLIATFIFIPSMPVKESLTYRKQIRVLKKPTMLISIILVILLNGAVFGFYSYLSDFLQTITHIPVRWISLLLLCYGLTNMIGNTIAGKFLTRDAHKLIFILPLSLIVTYSSLLLFGHLTIQTVSLIAVLGIFVGITGNLNQFLISDAGPEAPDFSNGLFLTAANLGTTLGTYICGKFLITFDTKFTLLGSLLFLALSIIFIILRIRASSHLDRKQV